jgi:hypothetical protein
LSAAKVGLSASGGSAVMIGSSVICRIELPLKTR